MIVFDRAYIGWSKGSGFVSRMISRLDGYWTHVYFRFSNSVTGYSILYESHIGAGVQITPSEHFDSAVKRGKVVDYGELSLCVDADLLYDTCLPYHGKGYDVGQILRYYIWTRFFRRKKKAVVKRWDNKKYTCNEFVITVGRQLIPDMMGLDYSFTPNRLYKRMIE